MNIDRSELITLLRERGSGTQADRAERDLPGQVDTTSDAALLHRFGFDIDDLTARFARPSTHHPRGR